jgi:hypothetical protein
LRDHIGERAQDRGENADAADDIAAVTLTEKIRNRELAELAQIGREQKCDQAVAAGPAHDEREPVEARQVQRARHPDERSRAHPVGAGCHAVEECRYAPAGDIIFGWINRAAHDADAGIEQDRAREEAVTDPLFRQAHLLGYREQDEEDDEADGIKAVVPLELAFECLMAHH